MTMPKKIGILGAGAIGCYVGGRLAARGDDVVFVGRERTKSELETSGLTCVDVASRNVPTLSVAPGAVRFETDAEALAERDVVLVCVKSAQTADAAASLARVLVPDRGTIVISFQNGVRNADVLREGLRGHRVLGGVVAFNVVPKGSGTFRRTTEGPLVIERSSDARVAELARSLDAAGFGVELAADIRAIQWAKLVVNLNNAVSALCDVPTATLVFDPSYRRILAALVREALDVLRRAGIRTGRIGPIPVRFFPSLLALPTPLLRGVARVQSRIDRDARSSMWEDLTRRRATEVDFLNGEIVALAEKHGTSAPKNRRIVELVHAAERAAKGPPGLSADALWAALHPGEARALEN